MGGIGENAITDFRSFEYFPPIGYLFSADIVSLDDVNSTYDYITVGGGSAGCVLASRLSEDPEIRVLLLEAGGEETKNINISIPVASPAAFNTAWDWAYHTTPQKNSGFSQLGGQNRHYWPRGKGIGGSNNLNALQYVRGSRSPIYCIKINIPVILDLPVGLIMEDHIYSFIPTTINSSEGFTGPKAQSISSIAQYMVFGEGPLSAPLIPGTAFIKSSTCETRYPDLQFNLMAALPISEDARVLVYESEGLFPETWTDGLLMATILLHTKSKGSVSLKSNDPFDYPNIDPNYFDLEEDIRKMIGKVIRKGIELLKTKPFAEIGADFSRLNVPHCTHYEFLSDEQLKCFIQHFAATLYHTSTCRMGSLHDQTSMVDPQLHVKGIRNLRVVDASVMPHVTSGNTNAPTIMIAEKAADIIRGIDSVEELRRKLKET
ncbi:alcohol dehydrogenase [acceptor]-like [Mya arenaria]|uniref:alcohol dehydrogenase [acceptor]-like n=1 Tax=Mya arenaria TaxID=6604 RepID=UPI0022E44F6B|nr:alcohol dehydrogenase [acceptor]-like [Mya arenaria]